MSQEALFFRKIEHYSTMTIITIKLHAAEYYD
jgi:hypothetical protein